MATPIPRSFTTAGGSTLSANGASLEVSRALPAANQYPDPQGVGVAAQTLLDASRTGNRDSIKAAAIALERKLKASKPGDIGAEQLMPLVKAGDEAQAKDSYSVIEFILSCLALGIPFIIDAANDSKAEAVLDAYERLSSYQRTNARMLRPDLDGDISGDMNLIYAPDGLSPLAQSTGAMVGIGEPWNTVHDAVAAHSYSLNATLKPLDFERSAGVLLTHALTRTPLSAENGELVLLRVNGTPAYRDENNQLRLAGGALAPVGAQVAAEPVEPNQIHVRFRVDGDPAFRPNMPFRWRGWTKDVEVGWWGQCHASGMLGSVGVAPAKAPVSYYDEASGKKVALHASQITSLMVLYGDRSFFVQPSKDGAGTINRSADTIDNDKPQAFHEFVLRAIKANVPFNLESFTFDQVWNYPVAAAQINTLASSRKTFGGFDTDYEMVLTQTNGKVRKYYYRVSTNRDGRITGSEWDVDKSRKNNEDYWHQLPDAMIGYLSPMLPMTTLTPADEDDTQFGYDERAARTTLDLYFASRASTGDRVYAVRKKNGELVQVSASEFEQLP